MRLCCNISIVSTSSTEERLERANFRATWSDSPGDSSEDIQMSTQSSVGLIDDLPILDFSYLMEE